jgi:hypothetical protein
MTPPVEFFFDLIFGWFAAERVGVLRHAHTC